MENNHTIIIRMTKYSDLFGKILGKLSHNGFTHTSISIDGDDTFYSFNSKGFSIEKPKIKIPKCQNGGSLHMKLEISEKKYLEIKNIIDSFIKNKENYKYSKLGVAMCLIKLPIKRKQKYFCSEFVAEIIKNSGIIKLKKKSSYYSPQRLFLELRNHILENNLVYSYV